MTKFFLTSVALFALCAPAMAQDPHAGHDMAGMKHEMPKEDAMASDSTKEFMEGHHKMMKDMDVKPTGDADKDFVSMMLPHHQGAVDMAKIVLAHGKDPELRKLAEGVITEQEKEIAFLRDWLKKRGK